MERSVKAALITCLCAFGIWGGAAHGQTRKLNGFEYRIVKDVKGRNAAIGDIIEFNVVARCGDITFANTWTEGGPTMLQVARVTEKGNYQAIFPYLSAGDSVEITAFCDTILKTVPKEQHAALPQWVQKGKKIKVSMSVVSVRTEAEFKQLENDRIEQQKAIDDDKLQKFLVDHHITATRTASGLYYKIQEQGDGAPITKGQTIGIKYKGMTLDGNVFDSNLDSAFAHTALLTFEVGGGQMIAGMDEGVRLLKKGGKATFYIPSALGYGAQSPAEELPPYSIMIFEVAIPKDQ